MNTKKLSIIFIGFLICGCFFGLGIFYGSMHPSNEFSAGNSSQSLNAGGPQVFFSVATSTLETISSTAVIALSTSTGRTWAKFSNNSAFPVFCRFDNGVPAANNTGFLINASSTFDLNQLSQPVYTGGISCVAQGGTANLYVEVNQ